ncbi:M23 family metallopeptidase [Streptomyces tagetis]|uniref:M23 family metallopeptidase n=1 Tax=Streptomyces tagetis TaxID=2820809 RepID=A0A941AYC5_9ACTN|nr:M23 family metallopeptidase [Streptomyces sp. RG38]MBQ0827274.1 M23 family metallopeptidase [Streptomyces sp. RG38]
MFPRVTSRLPRPTTLRSRAALMAAGIGASVALGSGVAAAAGTSAAPSTSTAASSVQAQAQAQAKAAQTAKAGKSAQTAKAPSAATKKTASWVDPVAKYSLTASFAQNGGMWASKHSGQDFAVPVGTDVVAVHGGTVVKAGGNGAGDGPAYGNAVVIKHGSGTYSQYAHLSRVDVKVGQVVKTGQHIAKSGNTGNSSGPHLHFEIRTTPNYGSAVDPVAFLRGKGVTV